MKANQDAQKRLKAISEIVGSIIDSYKANTPINLTTINKKISAKYSLPHIPKLVEIISGIPEEYKSVITPLVKAKPVRTASGIAVVAIMSKPHRCPHIATTGNICVYCPGGPDSDFE